MAYIASKFMLVLNKTELYSTYDDSHIVTSQHEEVAWISASKQKNCSDSIALYKLLEVIHSSRKPKTVRTHLGNLLCIQSLNVIRIKILYWTSVNQK